jgi:hypothetical protein
MEILLYGSSLYFFVVWFYSLLIPWRGFAVSNKASHGYSASVGSSRQIPLKKELSIQVKPFF